METQSKRQHVTANEHALYVDRTDGLDHVLRSISKNIDMVKLFCEQNGQVDTSNLLTSLTGRSDKKSFLVFKHNKYFTIPVENIAFFYIKYDSSIIMCFDQQEYFVSHSLEQIQHLVTDKQFFRLNRQYLINFNAIKEAEHYFARKLLVNLAVPVADKLLVSKEKVTGFLQWLDNR